MSPRKPQPAPSPEVAADAGFPVAVDLASAYVAPDGPLTLVEVDGSEQHYEVAGGVAQASTRARLDALVAIGGVPLISPTGDAVGGPAGGTAS